MASDPDAIIREELRKAEQAIPGSEQTWHSGVTADSLGRKPDPESSSWGGQPRFSLEGLKRALQLNPSARPGASPSDRQAAEKDPFAAAHALERRFFGELAGTTGNRYQTALAQSMSLSKLDQAVEEIAEGIWDNRVLVLGLAVGRLVAGMVATRSAQQKGDLRGIAAVLAIDIAATFGPLGPHMSAWLHAVDRAAQATDPKLAAAALEAAQLKYAYVVVNVGMLALPFLPKRKPAPAQRPIINITPGEQSASLPAVIGGGPAILEKALATPQKWQQLKNVLASLSLPVPALAANGPAGLSWFFSESLQYDGRDAGSGGGSRPPVDTGSDRARIPPDRGDYLHRDVLLAIDASRATVRHLTSPQLHDAAAPVVASLKLQRGYRAVTLNQTIGTLVANYHNGGQELFQILSQLAADLAEDSAASDKTIGLGILSEVYERLLITKSVGTARPIHASKREITYPEIFSAIRDVHGRRYTLAALDDETFFKNFSSVCLRITDSTDTTAARALAERLYKNPKTLEGEIQQRTPPGGIDYHLFSVANSKYELVKALNAWLEVTSVMEEFRTRLERTVFRDSVVPQALRAMAGSG